jgi:predicted DNA binding CopG/RHH family protein
MCLLKVSKKENFNNLTIKLPKYQKLLEGLTDDQRFKDMIPIITFGS